MRTQWMHTLRALGLSAALAGCVSTSPPLAMFDLRVLGAPSPASHTAPIQLLVPVPTAIDALATDRIVVRPGNGQALAYLAESKWSDRLPSLLQARLVQALQAAGVVKAVGRPGDGLAIDDQLQIDIQDFAVFAGESPHITIRLYARLLNDHSGQAIAAKLFEEDVPLTAVEPATVAAGFETGLGSIGHDLATWISGQPLDEKPTPKVTKAK